ncbi:YbhB/YbcL family Raf kinase inhibitor-like protein [Citrobacter braakii]|uniref:YbhB/YbcL family Raf kinase inhibitor-like protein n=1 Tax=Citrobacter braakii TaxID=57706 RepID=UPI00103B7F56|nr:YbhB/YbcL family Raf kinase inhibitor-like protein [Citrobacter braakii]TCC90938.1 YbhB/YbcL family Raf kinase inhibitor-like protein [Citrobacter braakii]HAT7507080.1 YbhB/YbcL family Raf kinase inhibitor-like protein [Citrobacter braakii]
MRLSKKVMIATFILWSGVSSATGYAARLTLRSSVLHNGENISVDLMANDFGCKGKNIQPELSWQSSPEGTRSYAITLYDKDADTGSGFWHWMLIDIPAVRNHLSRNEIPDGATIKANDTGKRNYLGPCPPVGKVHSYIYTLHALDVEKLDVPDNSTAPLTGYFINQHTLATSTLTLKVVRNQ